MPTAKADGIAAHYEEAGQGDPLVLIGTWSCCDMETKKGRI